MRMGPGGLLQNAEGTAGAETEAKEGVLRAGRGATCGSGPAGSGPRWARESRTYRIPQGRRASITAAGWDFPPPRRMQTDAVCKWGSPVHQVCAVATTRPSRAEPGEGWRRQCTPSGGECDGPSTHTAVETRTGCRRNVPGEGVPLIPGSTTYLTKTHDAKCQRAHHARSVSTQSNFLFGAVLVIYTQPAFLIS